MARSSKDNSQMWVDDSFETTLICNEVFEEIEIESNEENREDKRIKTVFQDVKKNFDEMKKVDVTDYLKHDIELEEEHKQLLVRAMAVRIKRKMPEEELWKEIQKETGYNHKIVWQDMRVTTMKKLLCLLPANDLLENIPTEMQLSTTEWLLFDLILVHEKIDVININSVAYLKFNKKEPQCHQDLFDLVKEHDVENLVGDALIEAWIHLTAKYNSRGRQCSPMMLQLRWYQLKSLTRFCFYQSYARIANSDINETLQSVLCRVELSVLQSAIVVAYNKIITEECLTWETLIQKKRVILFDEFDSRSKFLHHQKEMNSSQKLGSSDAPALITLTLNDTQIITDFDKVLKSQGDTYATEDAIVIDLKDDKEYVNALQCLMSEAAVSTECSLKADGNDHSKTEKEVQQRLIREVGQMTLKKKHEIATWQKLMKEMGRDCKNMWKKMRDSTYKKVSKLLAANDRPTDIESTMQLSATDWLLFDLALVHDKINVVNVDHLNDSLCLRDLVDLVKKLHVENLVGEELAEAWIYLTLEYNSRDRQCSPMLLQLRWYQLKEMSRQQVYKPAMLSSRVKMLIEIATTYQKIITQEWSNWLDLIKEERVILPEQFIMTINQKGKWPELEARDGWYLSINSDVNNFSEIRKTTANNTNERSECNSEIKVSNVPNPTAKSSGQLATPKFQTETKITEVIELDSDDEINEILRAKAHDLINKSQDKVKNLAKLKCKVQNALGGKLKDVQQIANEPAINTLVSNNEPILCDFHDEIDKLLQEKANLMSIELPKKKVISGVINKEIINNGNLYEGLDEVDFDDNNIEFVDDGIIEDGSEYKTKKIESRTASSSDADLDRIIEESDEEREIDMKLLMDTKVYIKKIDCMEVFKFFGYDSIKDKRIIQYVESQSKPENKRAPKQKDIEIFREHAIPGYNKDFAKSNDEITFQNSQKRVKYTSWLLQKPKNRKYKAIQLLHNPDFNINLKTLSTGFFNSTRNRQLLKQCQPLTVDVHKSFEKKLINGTMYLKRSDFKSTSCINNHKITFKPPCMPGILSEHQETKLAEHVRNLIASMTSDNQGEEDLQISNVITKLPIKRSKVISLPDKDQIRLLNQSLLTAEITPRHQPLLSLPVGNDTKTRESNASMRTTCSSEESSAKRFKIASTSIGPGLSHKNIYCCWARQKYVDIQQNLNLDCTKHICVKNDCTCCCRKELINLLTSIQLNDESSPKRTKCSNRKKSQNIEISTSASFQTNSIHSEIGANNTLCAITKLQRDKDGISLDNIANRKTSIVLNHLFEINTTTSHQHIAHLKESTLLKKAAVWKEPTVCPNIVKIRKITAKDPEHLGDLKPITPFVDAATSQEHIARPKAITPLTNTAISEMNNAHSKAILPLISPESSQEHKTRPKAITPLTNAAMSDINIEHSKAIPSLIYTASSQEHVAHPKAITPLTNAETSVLNIAHSKAIPPLIYTATGQGQVTHPKAITPLNIAPKSDLHEQSASPNKARNIVIVPHGVNFVKLPDEKLAIAVNNGVQLHPGQLFSLMSICTSLNSNISKR